MLIKLKDPAAREQLAADALALLSRLPDVEECSVGLPADASSEKSWDLSIVLGFANAALLQQVLASAAFTSFLEVQLGERVAMHKAWSFARLA